MKLIKVIFGIFGGLVLLAGGIGIGTMVSQSRAAGIAAKQLVQPGLAGQQQSQSAAIVAQQQNQPTAIPVQQLQTTPVALQQAQPTPASAFPQPGQPTPTTLLQGQWGSGWWMMNPNHTWQGQRDWGHSGWNGQNHDCCDTHGGMMGGWGQNGQGYSGGWGNNGQGYPGGKPNLVTPAVQLTPSSPVSFEKDIQPIFAARCTSCHGGTGGLYLNTYENALKGGKDGAVILPGNVYNSGLAYYVYTGYMPYGGPALSQAEIQAILNWIAAGAPNN